MSRVIKANMAVLLPYEETPAPEETPAAEEEGADASAFEQTEDMRAYDELIEAATNEVAYMMEDARREAQNLRDEAIAQVDFITSEARETGREEGIQLGRTEGVNEVIESFRALFEEGQRSIDALREALRADFEARVDALRDDVLRLSMSIAEKILGKALEEDKEAYHSLVTAALASVQSDTSLTVRLNPREFLAHFQGMDTVEDPRSGGTASLVPDPTVPPGGCWIDTENGLADASVEAQLEQIAFHMGLIGH